MPNATDLTVEQLQELYAYPRVGRDGPLVRVNFVSSVDGAATVSDTSGGLGTPIDHMVFGVLRSLADVVLVGASTVRAENYAGTRIGQVPVAVVTASANLDPTSRLFTETDVPPIVLTCESASADRLRRLADAGADVVVAGHGTLSTAAILDALRERGFRRVLCEGGPHLTGQLISDDAVDELCLTISPILVGGTASRIAVSPSTVRTPMRCTTLLAAPDGTILTRWVRNQEL